MRAVFFAALACATLGELACPGRAMAQTAPEAPSSPEASQEPTAGTNGVGPITGRIFAHLRVPTSDPFDGPIQQASTSLWIQAKPRLNDAASAAITLTADALQSSIDPNTHLRADVREAYLDAVKGGFALRIGQQIISWGNADGINPTDFLTAKDFTFFSADSEVRRFGALSARASCTPNAGDSPLEFTLVATPVFPSSRLLVPPGIIPPAVTNVGLVRPPVTLANTELAARAAYTGSKWDIALVGFRGFNHTPEFFAIKHDATSATIGQTNRHQWGAGAQGSLTLGAWVMRIEGAYVAPDNPGNDPRAQPPHIDVVAGLERSFWERLRVQAQGLVRAHPHYPSPPPPGPDPVQNAIDQGIGAANAILLDYRDRIRPAASLRVAYATEDETFEAEISAYANLRHDPFSRADYLVRPMLTYRFRDPLKLIIGGEYFGGPTNTSVGALHSFSGAFVEAAYSY